MSMYRAAQPNLTCERWRNLQGIGKALTECTPISAQNVERGTLEDQK